MKKLATTVIAATLAGTLIPAPALALPIYEQGGYQAGQMQTAGSLMIREAGTYTLTGNLRGTVMVDPGAGEVTLVMDNVEIDGNGGPAINAVSGDRLTIVSPEGTNNRLISGMGGNGFVGTIMSGIDTVFDGFGQMSVIGDAQPAVMVENANLAFGGGTYNLFSAGHGIALSGTNPGIMDMNNGMINFHVGQGAFAPDTRAAQYGGAMWDYGFYEADTFASIAANDPWANPNQGQQAPGQNMQEAGQAPYGQDQNQQPQMPDQQGQNQQQMPAQDGQQQGQMGQPGDMQSQPGQPPQDQQGQTGEMGQPGDMQGQPAELGQPGDMQGQPGQGQMGQTGLDGTTDTAGEIVEGMMTNSAASLEADYDNATTYDVSEDSQVKITESGTYIVTGISTDGNITVKKGTTGVVLVLDDLDLTSTNGATLSVNKEAEVKIIVSGNVTLTDAENPDDEYSEDADVADAYDGAALKAKANSQVYITGDGTLNIEGDAKNGIKGGDDASVIIDDTTLNISAVNDGINVNYDVTILSGEVTIEAGDDAIHADHIVTIGAEDGTGPTVNIKSSTEGIEGTVVNILGGDIQVNSSDDAINAANADGAYEGELGYSINQTGGNLDIYAGGDGMDSNGNVNLVGGSSNISSANMGGEAGIDYDGELYVSDEYQMNNNSGIAGPDGMPGQMGQPGDMGQGGQMMGQPSDMGQGGQGGQMGQPGDMGQMGQMNQGG